MSLSKTGKFEWLSKTNLGVFFHWGIYSQLGRGEWVRFQERIPFGEDPGDRRETPDRA